MPPNESIESPGRPLARVINHRRSRCRNRPIRQNRAVPGHTAILRKIKSPRRRIPILLQPNIEPVVSRRSRDRQIRIQRTESNLAEPHSQKRLPRPRARDLCPGRPAIRRAQNSQPVVRIARTVRLPCPHQNHIAVPRLHSNRTDGQGRLIVHQSLPRDRSRIHAQTPRVRRPPKPSISSAQKHRVSRAIGRIDRHRSSSPRNPVVILHPIARSVRCQRSRPQSHPTRG